MNLPAHKLNSCFFTMVEVDDDRNPVPVPDLRPFAPEERRRHAAALTRRQLRQDCGRRAANPGS